MAKIIKRTDYKPYSEDINNIVYFCANCDSNGEGGYGGILASGLPTEVECRKAFCNFCPTCGTPINFDTDEIIEKTNYLR